MTSQEILAKAKEKTTKKLNLTKISFNLGLGVFIAILVVYIFAKMMCMATDTVFLDPQIEKLTNATGLPEALIVSIFSVLIGILVFLLNLRLDKRPLSIENVAAQKKWINRKIQKWEDHYEGWVSTLKTIRIVPEAIGFYHDEKTCLEKMTEYIEKRNAGGEALKQLEPKPEGLQNPILN